MLLAVWADVGRAHPDPPAVLHPGRHGVRARGRRRRHRLPRFPRGLSPRQPAVTPSVPRLRWPACRAPSRARPRFPAPGPTAGPPGREAQPAGRQHPQQVPVGHAQHALRRRRRPLDDPVGPAADLGPRSPPGTPSTKRSHPGRSPADLSRGQALVVPVVPLPRSASTSPVEPGSAHVSAARGSGLVRTAAKVVPSHHGSPAALGLRGDPRRAGNVRAAGVLSSPGPLGLPVTEQDQPGGHGPDHRGPLELVDPRRARLRCESDCEDGNGMSGIRGCSLRTGRRRPAAALDRHDPG